MHVTKYWRTKKLRYRLFSMTERNGTGRVKAAAEAQIERARDYLPDGKRVKAAVAS